MSAKPIDPKRSGPYDSGMEARIAKLEAHAEHIQRDLGEVKTDLRTLAKKVDAHLLILGGMVIASSIGLAGLLAKGFHWV